MTNSARLLLVNATLELLDAAVEDATRLGELLGASLADDWAGFPQVLPRLRELHAENPHTSWGTVLFLLATPRTLVGMGGYKGEPSLEGLVEIGYAVAPAFRGRGLATEAARALVARAFADPRVQAVTAHTLAEKNPSTGVLEKAGFRRVGEQHDPDVGALWRWQLDRAAGLQGR